MSFPSLEENYELGDELGRGGFGVVYRARRLEDGRASAAKVLLQAPDADQRARLDREAATLRGLDHPRLVAFHGLFEDATGQLVLVYDEAVGETLEERLERGRPSPDEARTWCEDVAAALQVLHTADVVHRDLKPGNLVVGPDGRLTLLDFGLARSTTRGATVTVEGMILGTPGYMAPELFLGEPATSASDVYAFGCLVHELATGHLPFTDEHPAKLARAHADASPPDLPGWASAANQALAKDPTKRPSAPQLSAALRADALPQGATVVAPQEGDGKATLILPEAAPTPTPPSRLPIALVAILGLILGATLVRPPAPSREAPTPTAEAIQRELPEGDPLPLLYPSGDAWTPGTPTGPGIPLGDGRVAFVQSGCRILVADLASGAIQQGTPIRGCDAESAYPAALFPDRRGGAWALVRRDREALLLLHLPDPLTGIPDAEEELPGSHHSIFGTMQPAPRTIVAITFGYTEGRSATPSELWVSRDGERPTKVMEEALEGSPVPIGTSTSPKAGLVVTVGERKAESRSPRNTLLGLDHTGKDTWRLDLPPDFELQAGAEATDEGIYLAGRRLFRLPLAGLRGAVSPDALVPVSPPIPDLQRVEPRQLPGSLVAGEGALHLLLSPDTLEGELNDPRLRWLRLRPGRPEDAPEEVVLDLPGKTSLTDGSGSVRDVTATSGARYVVATVRSGTHQGHAVVLDLRSQTPYRTFELRHEENTARARGPASWIPYRGGALLMVAAETESHRAFVFERWFPPDRGPTR
jgi:serine/threonine-protein kinase